jgi:hypothetical protein
MPLANTSPLVAMLLAFEAYLEAAPDAPTDNLPYARVVDKFMEATVSLGQYHDYFSLRCIEACQGKELITTLLALTPPLPYVEARIATTITTHWRRRYIEAAEIVTVCIEHGRWRFLRIFLTSSGIDVNYNRGKFGIEAFRHESYECLRVLLDRGLDVSIDTRTLECSFYEGSACSEIKNTPCVCGKRRVATFTNDFYGLHSIISTNVANAVANTIGNVHIHARETVVILQPALFTYANDEALQILLPYISDEKLNDCTEKIFVEERRRRASGQ